MLSRKLNRWIIVLITGVLLMGCAASSKALIEEKDQELAKLQAELKQLEERLGQEQKVVKQLKTKQDDASQQLDLAEQKNQNYLSEMERLRAESENSYVLGNRIVLTNALVFNPGSADLSERGKQYMNEIWETLGKYPDREILIQGHTDNTPIATGYRWKYASNWELSAARALSVLHYFEEHKKVKPGQLSAVAYGMYHPVASNQTAKGRSENRRVEIVVGAATK